ncbi:hypothetical protein [Trichocoleus sp. FACHB-262]|uniref:hypothetical protein n=1 Tax=Trichocoleus sp. FACHB-262 TaxID=2692869 RepID=UPI001689ABDD|nr:hypothetical protein [Trichocoleus sp. FACHB-262]MBD2122190.1 hypothetical protein [Trichocoleus sp. FACHB-262]
MLVFFMHGVATRNVQYADSLQSLIREEFSQQQVALPLFYASFWGDVLNDVGKLWNAVHQNLQAFQSANPQVDAQAVFRYQNFRKGFFSEFVGDAFTYLNSERGIKIRKLIAEQLSDFISRNPGETELHIVSHSLGTVVLWDALFSERFHSDDPAFEIRSLIQGHHSSDFESESSQQKLQLKSITTMGSPIAFFNIMLGIQPEQVKALVSQYSDRGLRWSNLIHASDVIAYPLQPCLNPDLSWKLTLQDHYLQTEANPTETAVRNFVSSDLVNRVAKVAGLVNPGVQIAIDHAPMVAGAGDAHINYWSCPEVARLVADNLLASLPKAPGTSSLLQTAIAQLQQVPGMTRNFLPTGQFLEETLSELKFRDRSGSLQLTKNPAGVHHVCILNAQNVAQFRGYVGWLHTSGLKQAVEFIRSSCC